jgi:putative oxidoreductase
MFAMTDSTTTINVPDDRLTWSLFLLRAGVFIVMLIWTLDKFVQPEHTAAVFQNFYGIGGLDTTVFYVLGAIQMVIILAFAAGIMKTWSYGAVMLFHSVSTLSSYNQYLDAFNNLLFFAAWPMLAACVALFMLRDFDTRFTWKK